MASSSNFFAFLTLSFFSSACFASDDPAIVETAKRMNWSIEAVQEFHQTGCESGRSKEMTICGAYAYVQADMKLNAAYSQLLAEMETKVAKLKLVSAQRAWIAYRDSACTFEADGYLKSKDYSAVAFSCKGRYTTERIAHLEGFLACDGKYGCPGSR